MGTKVKKPKTRLNLITIPKHDTPWLLNQKDRTKTIPRKQKYKDDLSNK